MRKSARRSVALATVLGAVALWAASAQPAAAAEFSFCPPGSGAGQCSAPSGIATDFGTDRLYVADRDNNRIDVFKASTAEFLFAFGWGVDTGASELQSCTTASTCQAGIAGSGAGQLSSPQWIALDNNTGSANRHDVYVLGSSRVNHFAQDGSFIAAFGWGVDSGAEELQSCTTASVCQAGIANEGKGECQLGGPQSVSVGPGGNVFVSVAAQKEPNFIDKVEKFSPAGACLGETVLVEGNHRQTRLVVDAAEDAWVADERENYGLHKYDLGTAKTQLCEPDPGVEASSLALDEAGHIFAYQQEKRTSKANGSFRVIGEFDSATCDHVSRFGYGSFSESRIDLATDPAVGGDIFAAELSTGIHTVAIPAPGPIVPLAGLELLSVGNAKTKVRAEVNPEGKATEVHAEYVTDADFEADVADGGNGFEGPGTKSTEAQPLTIPPGREFRVNGAEFLLGCPVATKELIEEEKCLTPREKYHWRVIATNADNPSGAGEATVVGPQFETKDPIEVVESWASGVGTDTATLSALVNPLGIPASGYFEYVSDADFKASGFAKAKRVPDSPPQAEVDFGSGEAPHKSSATLFPLSAGTTYHFRVSATNPLIDERQSSEAGTFTTFRAPLAEPCPANEAFRSGPGARLPDCRAYEMVSPLDKGNGDIVVLGQRATSLPAVLDQSSAAGGRLSYGSYRAFGDSKSSPLTAQYLAARDPQVGWESEAISPPADHSILGAATFDFEFRQFSEDLCESWMVSLYEPVLAPGANPGNSNLYRRRDKLCGGESFATISAAEPEQLRRRFEIEPQGHSADGTVAVFAANDRLEGTLAQPDNCVEPAPTDCKPQLYVQGSGGTPRFACILPNGAAYPEACTAGGGGRYLLFGSNRSASLANALSADGSRLFWTAVAQELDGRIYMRENPLAEGPECAGPGSPCTIAVSEAAEGEAGTNVSHFLAAARDGSRAIFTSGGRLFEFDVENQTTQEIAGLVSGVVGVSDDATQVYFASKEVRSGEEENANGEKAAAGEPNLYLHSGPGVGSYRFIGTLRAADVNVNFDSATADDPYFHHARVTPDGSAVAFMATASLTGYDNSDAAGAARCGEPGGICDNEVFVYDAEADGGAGELVCASCNPSGGRPAGARIGNGNIANVAARIPGSPTDLYASRLLAADGSRLFFESQDALVPGDTNSRLDVYQWEREGTGGCSSGSDAWVPSTSGCIDLISSGQDLRDTEFVDASANGDDVFINTLASLVPQDYGLADVYDARVGGGFPAPPAPPGGCEGEACQAAPAPPPAPTPASATFRGKGNAVRRATPRCRKPKVRRSGRCVAKKHRKHRKHRKQSKKTRNGRHSR